LGTHFAFYFWNESFASNQVAKNTIERYFEVADHNQRAKTISDISRIFSDENPREDHSSLYHRVTELWEERFSMINGKLKTKGYSAEDVREELSAFVRWLGCECFPFEWRLKYVLQAIHLLDQAPHAAYSMRTLEEFSSNPERLNACLQVLEALLTREREIVSWTYSEIEMKPILSRGIHSQEDSTRDRAKRIQELLLRNGLFSYLDLSEEPPLDS
jgi:AcrR family transcriptional regulator